MFTTPIIQEVSNYNKLHKAAGIPHPNWGIIIIATKYTIGNTQFGHPDEGYYQKIIRPKMAAEGIEVLSADADSDGVKLLAIASAKLAYYIDNRIPGNKASEARILREVRRIVKLCIAMFGKDALVLPVCTHYADPEILALLEKEFTEVGIKVTLFNQFKTTSAAAKDILIPEGYRRSNALTKLKLNPLPPRDPNKRLIIYGTGAKEKTLAIKKQMFADKAYLTSKNPYVLRPDQVLIRPIHIPFKPWQSYAEENNSRNQSTHFISRPPSP